jgi:hypothetical protein
MPRMIHTLTARGPGAAAGGFAPAEDVSNA